MPKKNNKADRTREIAPELHAASDGIGKLVLAALEQGAYVGCWHNHAYGLNIRVRWENDSEDFYAATERDVAEAIGEVEAWIHEKAGTPAKKNGKKTPQTRQARF